MQELTFSQDNVQGGKVKEDHERGITVSITARQPELLHNELILESIVNNNGALTSNQCGFFFFPEREIIALSNLSNDCEMNLALCIPRELFHRNLAI